MTAFAMGVHKQLVDDGIAVDSADYYRQIDDHMRKRFPEKFEKPQSEKASQAAPVVAPASRATTRNPRKVRLTQTQVALAKRLGVPPEKYAAQLLKDQKDG